MNATVLPALALLASMSPGGGPDAGDLLIATPAEIESLKARLGELCSATGRRRGELLAACAAAVMHEEVRCLTPD